MGLFDRETEQERAERQRRQAQEDTARAEAEARAVFASTPVGAAIAAKLRGDRYLRVEFEHARVERSRQFFGGWDEGATPTGTSELMSGMITEVEEQGWEWVSATTSFIPGVMEYGGSDSSGRVGGAGSILGTYFFRATEVQPDPGLVARLHDPLNLRRG